MTEAPGARPWSWHTAGGVQADRRAGLGMALQPLIDDLGAHLGPCRNLPPSGVRTGLGEGSSPDCSLPASSPELWAWGHR